MRRLAVPQWRERGQALVEFSLVGIIFFLVVLGMVDVGRAVWNYNTLSGAAREGTRYAIVHGSRSSDPSGPGSPYFTSPDQDTQVTAVVRGYSSGLDLDELTVRAEWLDGSNEAGNRVKVKGRYTYEPIFDFLGILSFQLRTESTMEITY